MKELPHHAGAGRIMSSIREVIFGLEDGLVSTMGSVVGIAAGTEDRGIVILSGLVIIMVEALSMAAGSYLSSKSHTQMLKKRIRDEEREIEEKPEEEREELRQMYEERGFSKEETAILVRRITSDKKLWLEEMMAKELRIGQGDMDVPQSSALIMGFAYIIGGAIPVIPFFFFSLGIASLLAIFFTLIALFSLGYWKASSTGGNPWKGGLEMLLISALAAGLGFLIGKIIRQTFLLAPSYGV